MSDFRKALRQIVRPPPSTLAEQLQFLKAHARRGAMEIVSSPAQLPDGVEETTPFGRHYVVSKIYDGEYFHGNVRLARLSTDDLAQFMMLMRAGIMAPGRSAILFLDAETTGMQGGVGMCPFLVGLGYFVEDEFHTVQYFARDFDEEPSMLYALGRLIERFRLVVTYNGAAFDVPLLETRFTLARQDSPFKDLPHLDLLTSARRLWRNGHGSCRLIALEHSLLSFMRGPDIPGAVIPRAYFDFLQGRSGAALHKVFTHNTYDVVSLAALTVCACDRVTSAPAALDDPLDLYSLARILENTSEWKRAVRLYEMALSGGLPEPVRQKSQENLAVLFRRSGDHERAFDVCKELIARQNFSFTGYEGAAIYYERVAGDPARALAIVEHGLMRLQNIGGPKRWKAVFEARRERLRQKAIQFGEGL